MEASAERNYIYIKVQQLIGLRRNGRHPISNLSLRSCSWSTYKQKIMDYSAQKFESLDHTLEINIFFEDSSRHNRRASSFAGYFYSCSSLWKIVSSSGLRSRRHQKHYIADRRVLTASTIIREVRNIVSNRRAAAEASEMLIFI
ncbi:UNVERIFIED_CONTAM: hypothetical protein PYX00_005962 [Menopon gallinae]|uniref:Uncharacterized protein n=1 Tax=Menopon gallinae TaxID=328185 RepID=A0AAW2HU45_9NEOP